MITNENGHRYKKYDLWDKLKHLPYDYEKNGTMKRIVSHKIWKTDNEFLQDILKVCDATLTILMKTTDVLHNWHYYLWKNR